MACDMASPLIRPCNDPIRALTVRVLGWQDSGDTFPAYRAGSNREGLEVRGGGRIK